MNSSVIKILEILSAAKSLNSVGFSAGYNFSEEKAEEFFEELVDNIGSQAPIFSGIMIIEEADHEGNFIVVDGLQRLTTFGLLLGALCEGYKGISAKNEIARRKVFTRYLTSGDEVKLRLAGSERAIYEKIILSQLLAPHEEQTNLSKTFQFFLSKIKDRKISATDLFKLVSRIQFMVVFTDKSNISARELYQSLNGNKDDFSQINLITSFIAQNASSSTETWQNIIDNYEEHNLMNFFKYYIRDFLTVQNNGKVPDEKQMYKSFKGYFNKMSKYQDSKDIIDNLEKYSKFYLKILQADFEDLEIQNQIIMINENNGRDSYPYLMEVLDDLESSNIDRGIFLDILTMINAFVTSRYENGTENDPSMAMNFASLSCEINKMLAVKEYESESEDSGNLTINKINQLSTFEV